MFNRKLKCLFWVIYLFVSCALADEKSAVEGVRYSVPVKFPALSEFIDEPFVSENNLKEVLIALKNNQSLKETISDLQLKIEKGDEEAEKRSGHIYKELVFLYEWVRFEVRKREEIKNGINSGN